MAIAISVESVKAYPGVVSAGVTDDAIEAVIADAVGQAIVIAPALADAEDALADGAAAVIRPAVARWIIRAASGAGRQRTATAGSFSYNESGSENIHFYELSEERKLEALARSIEDQATSAPSIVDTGLPRYVWA